MYLLEEPGEKKVTGIACSLAAAGDIKVDVQ